MSKKRILFALGLILVLAGFLRFWGLGSSELLFDEGAYGFRSIGYLDYLESGEQSTPIQWLADKPELPSWLKLSFHDHPPLFFLTNHIFFKVFGDALWVARLPSALFGIASVLFIFFITRNLFWKFSADPKLGDLAGLIGASLGSVSFALVSISRLVQMESLLMFLILFNIYLFLKFLENQRYWLVFGITLGLVLLTKYVSVFLVPVYFVFLFLEKSPLFRNPRLYTALLAALLVFSPVIIYNIYFYQAFGHFDLQFAHLLGEETPEWQGESGKTQEPFSNIVENLMILYSIPFMVIAILGLGLSFFSKKTFPLASQKVKNPTLLMFLLILFTTPLLIVVGSAIRFSVLYAIPALFFITLAALVFWERFPKKRWLLAAVFSMFLLYELKFTLGPVFIESPDYGVAKLDRYFDSVFGEARTEGVPRHPNQHLDRVIQTYAYRRPAALEPVGIIYDDDLLVPPALWLMSRRQYYQGIPIIKASSFLETLQAKKAGAFKEFTLYFVKAGPAAPIHPKRETQYAEQIEEFLKREQRIPEVVIRGYDDLLAFTVYKFQLE